MNQSEFNKMLKNAIDGGALDEDAYRSRYTGDEIEAYLTKMKNAPEGATTMDAEVIDIRTGFDGTKYPTAGDAVRTIGARACARYDTYTMIASEWSDKQYSFENVYPSSKYNISIEVAPTATSEQFESFGGAMICGSADSNIATAIGDVPTVDIPIIIKAVGK